MSCRHDCMDLYRGTSLKRNSAPLGPYSGTCERLVIEGEAHDECCWVTARKLYSEPTMSCRHDCMDLAFINFKCFDMKFVSDNSVTFTIRTFCYARSLATKVAPLNMPLNAPICRHTLARRTRRCRGASIAGT